MCGTCGNRGSSTDDPLLECVAQCDAKHHHMKCVELAYVPVSWLCKPCVDTPVFVIRHVMGKRIERRRTEYLVGWISHEAEPPTWQAVSDIPPGSRNLVNAYNTRLRIEAQQQQMNGGGGGNNAHKFVGKKVAKNFSHGAVYVGYVTEHYPAEMEEAASGMSEELFHVEYGDGDEEDLDHGEVSAAIALAAAGGI